MREEFAMLFHKPTRPSIGFSARLSFSLSLRPVAVLSFVVLGLFCPSIYGQGGVGSFSLKIRVTDSVTETAIEQVRVELLKFPAGVVQVGFSDASGLIDFSGLQPDTYTIRGSKQGFLEGEVQVDVRRGEFSKSVSLRLEKARQSGPDLSSGVVSARALAIPEAAQKEFLQGSKLLQQEKNPKKAIPYFRRAVELFPNYFEAYFLLGMSHLQLNEQSEAQHAFSRAMALNPESLAPYYPMAMSLFSQKRYAEEEVLLLKAVALDKEGWQWPFELARCSAAQDQWAKALEYAQRTINLPTVPPKAHILLADIYSGTGKNDMAVAELKRFLELDPASTYAPRVKKELERLTADRPH